MLPRLFKQLPPELNCSIADYLAFPEFLASRETHREGRDFIDAFLFKKGNCYTYTEDNDGCFAVRSVEFTYYGGRVRLRLGGDDEAIIKCLYSYGLIASRDECKKSNIITLTVHKSKTAQLITVLYILRKDACLSYHFMNHILGSLAGVGGFPDSDPLKGLNDHFHKIRHEIGLINLLSLRSNLFAGLPPNVLLTIALVNCRSNDISKKITETYASRFFQQKIPEHCNERIFPISSEEHEKLGFNMPYIPVGGYF